MAKAHTTPTAIRTAHKDWQFPDFEVKEFAPKAHKYAVCVFVINEGKKIQKQMGVMQKYADKIDIIIADGGSTDGSLADDVLKKK